jgi:aryl-alcohol dehydrogenase-like predicted oxidoreductase
MRAVPLGGQGLTVSWIGLGCMGMANATAVPSHEATRRPSDPRHRGGR